MKKKRTNGNYTLHIKLDKETLDRLRMLCEREHRTMHNLAQMLITKAAYDRATERNS